MPTPRYAARQHRPRGRRWDASASTHWRLVLMSSDRPVIQSSLGSGGSSMGEPGYTTARPRAQQGLAHKGLPTLRLVTWWPMVRSFPSTGTVGTKNTAFVCPVVAAAAICCLSLREVGGGVRRGGNEYSGEGQTSGPEQTWARTGDQIRPGSRGSLRGPPWMRRGCTCVHGRPQAEPP